MTTEVIRLTERDGEILQTLAEKARLLGQSQIADHWYRGERTNARRRMQRLAVSELAQRVLVMARPLPPLAAPLASWRPGEAPPQYGHVAYLCQERFRLRPVRQCSAWIATDRTAHLFGGVRRGELKHPLQATHDLGLAAIWLRLREVAPEWAAAWRSEDLFAHTRVGEKLPDAFIVDANDHVACVIEFGGTYDSQRIEEFHRDCAMRSLPYQLW